MRTRCALALSALLLAPLSANADPSDEQTIQSLCDAIARCTLSQLKGEGELSGAMLKMVQQMNAQVCEHVRSSFEGMPDEPDLKRQAQACADSMTALSCSELEALGDQSTTACKTFEEMVRAHQ